MVVEKFQEISCRRQKQQWRYHDVKTIEKQRHLCERTETISARKQPSHREVLSLEHSPFRQAQRANALGKVLPDAPLHNTANAACTRGAGDGTNQSEQRRESQSTPEAQEWRGEYGECWHSSPSRALQRVWLVLNSKCPVIKANSDVCLE